MFWFVGVGEGVAEDEVVGEIETDKVELILSYVQLIITIFRNIITF